jgi:hypothetical protein
MLYNMPDKIEISINMPNIQKHAKLDFTYLTVVSWNGFIYHIAINTTLHDWYANAWTYEPWSYLYRIITSCIFRVLIYCIIFYTYILEYI